MNIELRKRTYLELKPLDNGGLFLSVYLKGEPYGEDAEYFFPTIDTALAKIKEILTEPNINNSGI